MENKKNKKILKRILMIIIVIFILFFAHTIRNLIIISKLHSKTEEYTKSTNYHVKIVSNDEDGIATLNYYKKDDKQFHMFERDNNGKISKLMIYKNGDKIDIFSEIEGTKVASLDSNVTITNEDKVYSVLETENAWQALIYSAMARIKTINYNNQKCYSITTRLSLDKTYDATNKKYIIGMADIERTEIYIDKDTGLNIKTIGNNQTVDTQYEFNNVVDSIFIEPDINEYK